MLDDGDTDPLSYGFDEGFGDFNDASGMSDCGGSDGGSAEDAPEYVSEAHTS